MTVAELIEKLKELPQDMEVQFRTSEWTDESVKEIEIYDIDYVSIYDNIVTLE